MSQGGCFVNTANAAPVGEVVQVLLQLPGEAECKLQARVVWSQPVSSSPRSSALPVSA